MTDFGTVIPDITPASTLVIPDIAPAEFRNLYFFHPSEGTRNIRKERLSEIHPMTKKSSDE